MTDEKRCEPPPELRGVDGWHWVQAPVGEPHLARWHAAEWDDVEPLWTSTHHVYAGTPRYAVREWGYRYLAPVTPPATVAALAEALEWMIANDDTNEGDIPLPEHGNRTWNEINDYWIDGLNKARAALAAYRETGR